MLGKKLTIYGNGKQVRDVLYIDDLVQAFDRTIKANNKTRGGIYNIGGGSSNTLSVWTELGPILDELFGKRIRIVKSDARPGDQKIFISDIRHAKADFGWEPKVSMSDGVQRLYHWVVNNKKLFY